VLNGSCLLVRAEALREVGILDEQFFIFFEDVDLGIRLRRAGWESVACEAATILHHGHQTVSQPGVGGAMEKQMMRSRYLYFRKHLGPVRAGIGSVLIRAALLLRAAKPMACGLFRPAASAQADLLLGLVRYDPAFPLPHEPETERVPR
jgi:GT2 family glycosyltransferase